MSETTTALSIITTLPNDVKVSLQKFAAKLNSPPKKDWLKNTPDNKAVYIPIEIIEREIRQDFNGLYQLKLLSERRELNEYIVTARIEVFHPIIQQWLSYDGIGSVVIMQDKDASLDSFNTTKKKNALTLNAPKAYAEALKNAAKKIGEKYGANVNRKEDAPYEPTEFLEESLFQISEKFNECKTEQDLKSLYDLYPELHSNTRFKMAFTLAKNNLPK